ncbi:hypothetical protein UlMin_014478 [Ulmus minor]
MRHSWRLLLLRTRVRPRARLSGHQWHSQVQSQSNFESLRSFTSLRDSLSPSQPIFTSHLTNHVKPQIPNCRSFSSEPAVEVNDSDHAVISDIFSKQRDVEEVRKDLELNNIVISYESILGILGKLESSPDVARRFFDWVLESDSERLSSKSYNLMLRILGVNGLLVEFWGLVEVMKKKGYGVSKGVRDRVLEKFEEEGLDDDVKRLKGVFASGSTDNSAEKICSRICKIVRNEVWGDEVEKQIRDLNVAFSSDMVKIVLEKLGTDPMKALILFRWLDESGLFKHDQQTYNAMTRVLGREDCIDRFWKVIDEMRSFGFDLEVDTFAVVIGRFCKRRMIEDAVNLYEFAMAGVNKPSVHCCTFLLRKIVVGAQLNMDLFSRVVSIFSKSGNVLTDSMLHAVLKSLASVGRIGKFSGILKAMEEGGFVASGNLQSKIVFQLSRAGKKNEARKFVDNLDYSGNNSAWALLIERLCLAGDLDKASDLFRKTEDLSSAGYAFDLLVDAYCRRNKAVDAYKLLSDLAGESKVKPWHNTYKVLISKLLVQGGFNNALNVLDLMKNHGFPPFVDPFIEYVPKSGSGEDAVAFLKAMTSKRFPSTSVVLRVFEAYLEAGRHNEAQNFLSQCPGYIRNHPDVLNLFLSKKSGEVASTAPVAA